ncbi:MAG: 1-phosphofructokinase family hexose kinase [Armatimonadaceae bacterium]
MILCVGLTPTVQRTQWFTSLTPGAVNRARETRVTASGKGINVARVLTTLGGSAKLVQILGGRSGHYLAETLDAEGVPHHSVWAEDDAPTRTCLTILPDDGPATELVEEAPPVSPHDVSLLAAACKTALLEARAVCCSGSLPAGAPETFYADLVREGRSLGIPVVVDGQKGPLREALREKPFLVKPNREEAAATLNLTVSGDAEADARAAVRALTEAGAEWALVSMGKAGSLLGNGAELWRIVSPTVNAVNPIGSGDSLAAGFLYAHFEQSFTVPDAVVFGTACAAANCLTATSGVLRPDDVQQLISQVQLEKWG